MFSHFEFPFALILTHRRGVGLAFFKSDVIFSSALAQKDYYSLIKNSVITNSNQGNIEFLEFEGFVFSRVKGKTAENLFLLFDETLARFQLSSHELKTLLVGVGPGSFTGLRLGCSFANGLKLGSSYNLIPVQTYLSNELLAICHNMSVETECIEQLGDFDPLDESTGFVTFFDILACLLRAANENTAPVDFLLPEYGREPGPVLKLKKEGSIA